LEVVFWKYLTRFGAEEDSLYLDDLEKILPNFRGSISQWAQKNGEVVSDYVKLNEEKTKKHVLAYKNSNLHKEANRIASKYRRAIKKI